MVHNMRSLKTLLVVSMVFKWSYGYIAKPIYSPPKQYHFRGETIDLVTELVEPFEIWYSKEYNRSRIDLYEGMTRKYYYGSRAMGIPEKIIQFYPRSTEQEDSVTICLTRKHNPSKGDMLDFLSSTGSFVRRGKIREQKQIENRRVTVWTLNVNIGRIHIEKVLSVYDVDGVSVPMRLIDKAFDVRTGALIRYTVTNYYDYEADVKFETLNVDYSSCALKQIDEELLPSNTTDDNIEMAFHRSNEDTNSESFEHNLEINKFADQRDEFLILPPLRYSKTIQGTIPFPHSSKEIEEMFANDEIPEHYDLRMEGFISTVKNQIKCGSCWAFAAVATMEGVIARSNGGRLMDLSEQSIMDCAWTFNNSGCFGGRGTDSVYKYILSYGVPTEADYGPYLSENGVCKIKNMTNFYDIKGYVAVTPRSPNALKAAVYKYGPITVTVMATDNMQAYKNGILYDKKCKPGLCNHMMTLVGYGVKDGEDYWILKNSWGENWGMGGYIHISARDNNCGVTDSPAYPVV